MPETGVVKWFNNDKGYGFIKRNTGEDVFCHHSSIQASGYRTLNDIIDLQHDDLLRIPGLEPQQADYIMALLDELTEDGSGESGGEGGEG